MGHPNESYSIQQFRKDEAGALSILNVFLIMVLAIFAGIAIDTANLVTARTQLQVAADAAAHTALYMRETTDAETAKAEAIDTARKNMPTNYFGDVLRAENIHFGTYDRTTKTFNIDETSRQAAYVVTDRLAENANPVSSFLLQFIGYWTWDVRTTAVFETFRPYCMREGFVADAMVNVSSNNTFENGFCVHSNSYVSLSTDNTFAEGTIVSMPNKDDIDAPSSGMETNQGLAAALLDAKYRLRVLSRLDDWYGAMVNPDHEMFRPYIMDANPIEMTMAGSPLLTRDDLSEGHVNDIACTSDSGKFTLKDSLFENLVIRTNCKVEFSEGTELNNVVIITTNTNAKSVTAPNGVQLGKDDNCATGGGAQILTWGGVNIAADLKLYGGQIIAAGDVSFSANANGMQGASIISGGEISGTSNMRMAFCGTGMEGNFGVDYFRLAG